MLSYTLKSSQNRYPIDRRSPRTTYDDSRVQRKATVVTEASFCVHS